MDLCRLLPNLTELQKSLKKKMTTIVKDRRLNLASWGTDCSPRLGKGMRGTPPLHSHILRSRAAETGLPDGLSSLSPNWPLPWQILHHPDLGLPQKLSSLPKVVVK